MLKFRKILLVVLIILLLNTLFFNCYATFVTVTKENLNTSLQKLTTTDENYINDKITVSDKVITLTTDGENYSINYDLTTNNPTFSIEALIEKGMSYADFEEQVDNLLLPMLGYIAVANIQGIEFEDAAKYFVMSYFSNALSGSWSSDDSYVIVDDTKLSDGVTIDKSQSNSKTIYVSEFGERVMEYVNATYKDKTTIADEKNGVNSYELTTEKKDVTETSCKLVSTLTVNSNADFSKIKENNSQIAEDVLNQDITIDNADYVVTLKVGQKCRFESIEEITGHELYGSSCEYKDIDEKCAEITGKSVGKANGYIYIGETKKSFYITVEENSENKTLDAITLKIDTSTDKDNSNKDTSTDKDNSNKDTSTDKDNSNKDTSTDKDNSNKDTSTDKDNSNKDTSTDKDNSNKGTSTDKDNSNKGTSTGQTQQSTGTTKDDTTVKGTLPKTGINNSIYIVIMVSCFISLVIFGIKLIKYKDIK